MLIICLVKFLWNCNNFMVCVEVSNDFCVHRTDQIILSFNCILVTFPWYIFLLLFPQTHISWWWSPLLSRHPSLKLMTRQMSEGRGGTSRNFFSWSSHVNDMRRRWGWSIRIERMMWCRCTRRKGWRGSWQGWNDWRGERSYVHRSHSRSWGRHWQVPVYFFYDKTGVCSNHENIYRQLIMKTYHSSRSQSLNPLAKGLLAIFNWVIRWFW